MLWRDGLTRTRQQAVRHRLEGLGTVRFVLGNGVLVTLEHDLHPLVRSWPEVRVIGGVTLQHRGAGGPEPSRTSPSTERATP